MTTHPIIIDLPSSLNSPYHCLVITPEGMPIGQLKILPEGIEAVDTHNTALGIFDNKHQAVDHLLHSRGMERWSREESTEGWQLSQAGDRIATIYDEETSRQLSEFPELKRLFLAMLKMLETGGLMSGSFAPHPLIPKLIRQGREALDRAGIQPYSLDYFHATSAEQQKAWQQITRWQCLALLATSLYTDLERMTKATYGTEGPDYQHVLNAKKILDEGEAPELTILESLLTIYAIAQQRNLLDIKLLCEHAFGSLPASGITLSFVQEQLQAKQQQ